MAQAATDREGIFAGTGAAARRLLARATQALGDPRSALAKAFEREIDERRLFLWLPVAAGAGAILYLQSAHEPSFVASLVATVVFGSLALAVRTHRVAFVLCVALAAAAAGMVCGAWRSFRSAAPMIERVRILNVTGFIEEMDFRREGARFVLRLDSAEGMEARDMPYRIRLTTRQTPALEAGAYVALKARLLPPARAALPGGYDFARDAFFVRIGGVGSVLGRIDVVEPPGPPGLTFQLYAAIDRARNALARRVYAVIGADAGAIGAAMVTGKRDFLSEPAKELIREAGIFHIITISGVQMTLVAGIFFWGFRRLLTMSRTLALRYPVKKWAAALAIAAASIYDIMTGSRVGTERALFMTIILLGAVMVDRQALTMRNLALAALIVVVFEPDALLGASFQLSFAAVAALVAVYEARMAALARVRSETDGLSPRLPPGALRRGLMQRFFHRLRHEPAAMLVATFFATAATASFMAYHFHELSPYVLIGNPLTLTIIELFAIPGALLGAALYPFGLDGWVWAYVGGGIDLILWVARHIAAAPASTLHLPAFAPWAIVFLALSVLSLVIWRTTILRLTALPLAAVGLMGAAAGPGFDAAIAPSGEAAAVRMDDGRLAVLSKRANIFAAEQWLRADGDGRAGSAVRLANSCDALGCAAVAQGGRKIALVLDARAFAEDCARADIVVSPLYAPGGCAAGLVLDRRRLQEAGAVTVRWSGDAVAVNSAREGEQGRPWSPPARTTAFRGRPKKPADGDALYESDLEAASPDPFTRD